MEPFARPKKIQLPAPFGLTTQYIIPHAETVTLAKTMAANRAKLIEVRGTWPEKNMKQMQALYEWGFLRNDTIALQGKEISIMDCISNYLDGSPEGNHTDLYGYASHVDLEDRVDNTHVQLIYTHTHPPSKGSVEEWTGLRSYTKNLAITFAIGTELIGSGQVERSGILYPKEAFDPQTVFEQLGRRNIEVHLYYLEGISYSCPLTAVQVLQLIKKSGVIAILYRGLIDALKELNKVFSGELLTMVSYEHGYQAPTLRLVPYLPIVQYRIEHLFIHFHTLPLPGFVTQKIEL